MILAVEVDSSVITTLMAVILTAVITLLAWIVREIYRLARVVERTDERSLDHDRRLADLERLAPGLMLAQRPAPRQRKPTQ